ncbi:Membrane-bound serine protease (ClpP class) [Burkholderiales bacterium 8X]|nr:Membrane-bound serine protease (ClpP class) [Burkholderiales bacterium 8X]
METACTCCSWLRALILSSAAALGLACTGALAETPPPASGNAPRTVVLMQLEGSLGPAAARHVREGLALAVREKAQLAVLQVDSTGGQDDSVRSIVQSIVDSPVPVAAFASPEAAQVGGGAIWLLYASPIAAMTPIAVLGRPTPAPSGVMLAATPAAGDAPQGAATGGNPFPSTAQSLAGLQGRNPGWPGQAMLDQEAGLRAADALQQRVITLVARNVTDLLLQVNGRRLSTAAGPVQLATQRTQMIVFAPDWRTRLLAIAADPTLARLLLMIGICGLLLELARPGLLLPGAVGAVSMALAFYGLRFLEVNPAGLLAMAVGIGLVVYEGFRPIPRTVGLAGAAAFATGAMILIDPSASGSDSQPWIAAATSALAAVFLLGITRDAARTRRAAPASDVPALLGSTGELVDYADGEGWAQIRGDYWPVSGMGDLQPGEAVRVSSVEGSVLRVAPLRLKRGEPGTPRGRESSAEP